MFSPRDVAFGQMNESDTISHGLTTSTNPVGIPLDADRGVAHDQPSLNTSDPHLFCNAIRGVGDDGVDVLLARMSNAARTMEELRNFWMERYVTPSLSSAHNVSS